MRKILAILILLLVPSLAFASILGVQQGGTASSTLTGILMGNGISSIRTVTVGSGLLLSGTTLSSTAAGGTVTNIATTWPIIGGPITTTGTLSLDLSTSTLTATGPLTGSFIQIGSGGSLGIQASSPTQNGYLSLTDYQLLHTATTTFSSPLVYTLATNAVTCPTCSTGTSGAATTSFAATYPITLSTSPLITYGYNGLSTTSPWTNGRLVMVQGLNQVTSVATSSLTVGTGMSINNAATSFVIGNAPTFSLLSYIATSSAETNGQLAMWATTNGTPAGLRSVATGTISGSGPIGVTSGQSIIGTGLTISCATCNTSNATVSSIIAGTGLGGGTITTSGTIYDTSAVSTSSAETNGQLAYWGTTNGTPAGLRSVATGTVAASGNVTVTAAQSIIGSGLTVTVPWDWSSINVFSTTSIATTTSIYTVGAFFASSTQASQFPYASTTAITAVNASTTNLTVSGTATTSITGGVNLVGTDCFATQGTCLQTFVQNAAAYKQAVSYATAVVLSGTPAYNNGTNGVGATLTEVGTGALSVDGQAPSVGQRILVKNQADQTQNGIYTVTATGSGIASYILTRATDYNTSYDIYAGTTVPVLAGGTANADTQWTETTTGTIVIGTSNIAFEETAFGTSGPTSVSNSDGTLTISPTTGAVVASLALAHVNSWTGLQSFSNASSTIFSVFNTAYFGGIATSTFDSTGGLSVGGKFTIASTSNLYYHWITPIIWVRGTTSLPPVVDTWYCEMFSLPAQKEVTGVSYNEVDQGISVSASIWKPKTEDIFTGATLEVASASTTVNATSSTNIMMTVPFASTTISAGEHFACLQWDTTKSVFVRGVNAFASTNQDLPPGTDLSGTYATSTFNNWSNQSAAAPAFTLRQTNGMPSIYIQLAEHK